MAALQICVEPSVYQVINQFPIEPFYLVRLQKELRKLRVCCQLKTP